MRTLLKCLVVLAILGLLWAGYVAWQDKRSRQDIHRAMGSSKAVVSEELLKNAERLAETLRKAKESAKSNNETK